MDVSEVLEDLVAEQQTLDGIVGGLSLAEWDTPTPSPRWTVTDQIGHLTYFDRSAAMAIMHSDRFTVQRDQLFARFDDELAVDELTLGEFRQLAVNDRLAEWRRRRDELHAAAVTLDNDTRVEWYGPSMGAKSFLTARLMEVWAHGQDICDAVGAERPPTNRLRHIAQLGVITRKWSYQVRGQEPPDGDVRVELTAPSGDTWSWGPDAGSAAGSITGPAEHFCLVVTQRRHVDDTDLEVEGELATDWMTKAQAYAGGPTDGPVPTSKDGDA
ncbi:MAG: TIGR03084 family protein [Ilumatobacter sp.]|nr:TIGR03084 family protein [Ilumatobacter sp.]